MVKVYVGRGEIEIIFCVSCLHLKWLFEKAIMAKVKPPLFGTFLQNGSKTQSKQPLLVRDVHSRFNGHPLNTNPNNF